MSTLVSVDDYIEAKLVHSLHNSGNKSFQGCRRRWDWIMNGHYYPTVTPKPLEFGVAFHVGMEKLYDPITWHDKNTALSLALGAFSQTVDKQYLEFRKKNPELLTPEATEDYKDRRVLGLALLKYYATHVAQQADNNLRPVKVEVEFEVPISGPKGETIWCKCDNCWKRWQASEQFVSDWATCIAQHNTLSVDNYHEDCWKGLPVTFGGRIDALMQDDLGRYWIYDWKTAARVSSVDADYLWNDSQITTYLWALWTIGIPVAGFIYAEIAKAVPVEPEPLSRPYKGRLYSTNKQNMTTLEMFTRTVGENDQVAFENGYYDEYLDYLRSDEAPRFHVRHQIHRNETQLRSAGANLYQLALDITDPNVRIYPNQGKFNCRTCAFYEPCLGKDRGEDYEYTLNTLFEIKPRHYYEQPRSTDTRGGE